MVRLDELEGKGEIPVTVVVQDALPEDISSQQSVEPLMQKDTCGDGHIGYVEGVLSWARQNHERHIISIC